MYRPGFGRFVLPAFSLLWLILIWISEFHAPMYGLGITYATPGGSPRLVVASAPLSLERQGLRRGAVLDLKWMSAARLRVLFGMPKGMTVALPVVAGGSARTVVARAEVPLARRPAYDMWLEFFILTLSLPLAGYLGYRRPGIMIAALILFIAGGGLEWPLLSAALSGLPDWLFLSIILPISVLAGVFPVLALASFAIRLPNDERVPSKRTATHIIDAIVVAGFFFEAFPLTLILRSVFTALSALVVIAACLLSLRYAKPRDRARVGVVFAAVMLGGVFYAIAMIVASYTGESLFFLIDSNLSVLIVPVAVAYAILRYRVFDVGFVLNRTIVFTLTSALVLVAFAAMEFLVERYLRTLTHAESMALEFVIAVAVIVSAILIHRRVDHVVDRVLFRSRYEQEAALVRFATTAQFYTAQEPLVRDTIDAMVRYGRVEGAAIYLADAGGTGMACSATTFTAAPPRVDENDPASVALRAHRDEVDTHDFQTAFPGARLYPMVLAGRLAGVIATGERESGEAMPPDIDEAIRRAAAAVTISLAAIESDRIRQENAILQRRLTGVQPA
jgi:hypothetical protein